MTSTRKLLLDANILIRAVFGNKVRSFLQTYEENLEFYAPDYCIQEALAKIPQIAAKKKEIPEFAELYLALLVKTVVLVVDRSFYSEYEEQARARISQRDFDDWPVVATALLLGAPIWTEDRDFFGCGIATWTTDRVEIYMRGD